MANPELTEWIKQVSDDTTGGRIVWKMLNPTTYMWETPAPRARVILQQVERMEQVPVAGRPLPMQRKVVSYLLQVFDLTKSVPVSSPVPAVTINGALDAEANTQLQMLFRQIGGFVEKQNVEFLRSLLPK